MIIVVSAGGREKFPQVFKSEFLANDKEIFGKNQNVFGSDKKNLGKIKNFWKVIKFKKGFCANYKKKFSNLGEHFFFKKILCFWDENRVDVT